MDFRQASRQEGNMKKNKTLGQIAYEADKNGGQQNFGPWHTAPNVVREIHENMGAAIEVEVLKRLRKPLAIEERLEKVEEELDRLRDKFRYELPDTSY